MNKIAIVRIRGKAGVNRRIEETLCRMRLYNKYHCVIISNDKRNIGMFKRVKDYVTWGEIDKNTLTKLITERGRLPGNKKLNEVYIKEKAKTDVKEFSEMVYEGKTLTKLIPLLALFTILVNLYDMKSIKIRIKAYLWILSNLQSVTQKRKKIQSMRKIPDKEITPLMSSKFIDEKNVKGGINKILIKILNKYSSLYCRIAGIKTMS